jgi:ABC-type thiamine transport system ATPase subunit
LPKHGHPDRVSKDLPLGIQANLALIASDLERVTTALRETAAQSEIVPPELPSRKAARIAFVRTLLRGRRKFEEAFDGGMFGDPARDMLLDLYASTLEGQTVYVSHLLVASGAPATTSLRMLGILVDQGWVTRRPDPRDGRRALLSLTPDACKLLDEWVDYSVSTFFSALSKTKMV